MEKKSLGLIFIFCSMFVIVPEMIPVKYSESLDDFGYYLIDYACTTSFPREFTQTQDVRQRKQLLIDILLPLVLRANEDILAQRGELLRIKKTSFYLSLKEIRFIEELAYRYRVERGDYRIMLDELLVRVDILPVSLVIAQAAIESGWGTSRFARHGNNLFGLRGIKGLGMVPKGLATDSTFSVSSFDSLQACVEYYLWNINTRSDYEQLRKIRIEKMRIPYDSVELAQGLHTYSEMGYAYVDKVVEMIHINNLKSYDTYRLKTGQPDIHLSPEPVLLVKG